MLHELSLGCDCRSIYLWPIESRYGQHQHLQHQSRYVRHSSARPPGLALTSLRPWWLPLTVVRSFCDRSPRMSNVALARAVLCSFFHDRRRAWSAGRDALLGSRIIYF